MTVASHTIGYGQIAKTVLEMIADRLIEVNEHSFHYGPQPDYLLALLIKEVLNRNKHLVDKSQVRRTLNDLEKRDIISLDKKGNDIYVTLQEKGHRKIAKYSLQKILDYKTKTKKWDGRWFMVFFDVPESQKNKRDYLRRFLKEIGFYQYQQSVYIFPFECHYEIEYIRNIVETAKYAKYIVADKIEDENRIKTYFKL